MATVTTVVVLAVVSDIGLYWSSVFRRTVHATAVTYATVSAMTVVAFVVFAIAMSIHPGHDFQSATFAAKAPLYVNPLFFLTMGCAPVQQLYPEWIRCLGVFAFLGLLAIGLTLWNLRRSGEVVLSKERLVLVQ
jgi:hypothetical protein